VEKEMNCDFDNIIDRRGSGCIKWDFMSKYFQADDLVPMWVADMDFKAPPEVVAAVSRVAQHGIYGYTGVPRSYYDAVIGWMAKRHAWQIQKDWMVPSPGVVPALHMLVRTFSEPGDQVVVQTPVYYPFFDAIKLNGRVILENPLQREDSGYYMDLAGLEAKITPRTKMIILCNPHNPVSRVWQEDELRQLGRLCLSKNILVVADEIHGDIVYSGYKHVPFAALSEEFAANSVTCTAASKTFNLPGLQNSSIIIPNPELRTKFKDNLHSCGFPSAGMFGLAATEAAYRYGEPWLSGLLEYLEGNIAYLKAFSAENLPGLWVAPVQGTYLLWLDFRGCGLPAEKQGNFVREHARVALEPGFIFGTGGDGFERMNIACPRSQLAEAMERIATAVRSLR
jgi:cysteine-S-conjugate beta-lyase